MGDADPPGQAPSTRGLGRDALWMSLQVGALGGGQVLVSAIAVRQAGAAAYGEAALVISVGALVSAVDAGLGASVIRSVARAVGLDTGQVRREANREVAAAQSLYTVLAAGSVLVAVVAALLSSAVRDAFIGPWTIVLGAAGLAVHLLGAPAAAVATGLQRFRTLAAAASLGVVGNLAVVWMLSDDLGAEAIALGYAAGVLIQRALVVAAVRRRGAWITFRPGRDARLGRERLLRYGGPLMAAAAVYHFLTVTDLLVLSVFATGSTVGVYRAATLAPTWMMGALFRVFDVAFPAIARSTGSDDVFRSLRPLCGAVSIAAGFAFGLLAAHRTDVAALLLGQESALASDVILLYAMALALNVPGHGLLLLLMANDRHHVFARVTAVEGALNVVLTVALVALWSPVGAAVATLVSLGASSSVLLPVLADRRIAGSSALVHRVGLPSVAGGFLVTFATNALVGRWLDGVLLFVLSAGLAFLLLVVVAHHRLDPLDQSRLLDAARARE